MTNDNNTPIDTTDVTTTPLNVAATDATVTTAAATTSTILPAGNAADETTRRSLFGAAIDATVTTVGNITASTAAATTSTILLAGNAADETTRRSLFGAAWRERKALHACAAAAVRPARLGVGKLTYIPPTKPYVPKPTYTLPTEPYVPKPTYTPPTKPYVPKPTYTPPTKPYVPEILKVVDGIILCKNGYETYPIQGAKAKIVCSEPGSYGKKDVVIYSDPTDSKGYFHVALTDVIKNLLHCRVKLYTSPVETCKNPTNVNKGLTGVPLSMYG
ncbi:hypothetical protein F2Q68_00025895 [Brassica cretica]|uniref:Uncharacterized protein n=1 Tax=Brassica cretica TaxID=69181 RepID=A0A8S9IJX5_BRACR|nr:hypothetical protein F2Q68_00025895 [Brassica cretica]